MDDADADDEHIRLGVAKGAAALEAVVRLVRDHPDRVGSSVVMAAAMAMGLPPGSLARFEGWACHVSHPMA